MRLSKWADKAGKTGVLLDLATFGILVLRLRFSWSSCYNAVFPGLLFMRN